MKLTFAALTFMLAALAACNTIEGAGQDIETVGDEIEETANDAKN
ncbi:MAG: entericidin A/B family lipoprotein [Alphaproteobacteria bacterium]|nr:entericidin A/B family lipoprotein [Alphaproteobacteria bacterium]